MKNYACRNCGYVWYEPYINTDKKMTSWGCPNGCLFEGLDCKRDEVGLVDDIVCEMISKKSEEEKKRILNSLIEAHKRKLS